MSAQKYSPGDRVIWFRFLRKHLIKTPAEFSHYKNERVAIRVVNDAGNPVLKYVLPDSIDSAKLHGLAGARIS